MMTDCAESAQIVSYKRFLNGLYRINVFLPLYCKNIFLDIDIDESAYVDE